MKKIIYTFLGVWMAYSTLAVFPCFAQQTHDVKRELSGPVISGLTTDGVTVHWTNDSPADSRIQVSKSDSNYQPFTPFEIIYSDPVVTNHHMLVSLLDPGQIYKFIITSRNAGGLAAGIYFCRMTEGVDQYHSKTDHHPVVPCWI